VNQIVESNAIEKLKKKALRYLLSTINEISKLIPKLTAKYTTKKIIKTLIQILQ
tara:strand:- start:947 stop:1108 length:162 start_codon:yes stop_codon:yes gene_type:complete